MRISFLSVRGKWKKYSRVELGNLTINLSFSIQNFNFFFLKLKKNCRGPQEQENIVIYKQHNHPQDIIT